MAIKRKMLHSLKLNYNNTNTSYYHANSFFAILSFVSVTPFSRYHKKILIFSSAFRFQRGLLLGTTPSWIFHMYIDSTVKIPLLYIVSL
jgi:hypothetical protein